LKRRIGTSVDRVHFFLLSLVLATITLSGCSQSIDAQVSEGCTLLKEGWADVYYDKTRTEKYEEARLVFESLSKIQPRWQVYADEIGQLSDWKVPNWDKFKTICEVQE
jgi:hypothetical protein